MIDLLTESGRARVVGPREVREADVVLSLDGRFRAGRGQRTVTAVLDLGHLFERHGYGLGQWLAQNWRVASAVRRSDHLLAPSEAVRFGLQRYLRVPAERITVLPSRPRACFRRPSRERVEELRQELALPRRYFLFVGSRARRKNLALLGQAWQRAAPRLGPDVGLVLAGPGEGGAGGPALPGRWPGGGSPPSRQGGAGGVAGARDLGYVPLDRLVPLLAGAVAWLNPSLYEGSAAGIQEAMACGVPPLVAATGAQPHAASAAGLVLDPHDADEWARSLVAIAGDAGLRSRLSVAALNEAAEIRESAPRWEDLAPALLGTAEGT